MYYDPSGHGASKQPLCGNGGVQESGDTLAKKTTRDQLLESANDDKLKNCINEMYRSGAQIGDGGVADAIRHELATGELVGGKSHIKKGMERLTNLENIIKKRNLSESDLKIATALLEDLKSALGIGGQ